MGAVRADNSFARVITQPSACTETAIGLWCDLSHIWRFRIWRVESWDLSVQHFVRSRISFLAVKAGVPPGYLIHAFLL